MSWFTSKKKEEKQSNASISSSSSSSSISTTRQRTSITGKIETTTQITVKRSSAYEVERTHKTSTHSIDFPVSSISLDAIPSSKSEHFKINLNYQSPYRNTSPVYKSFNGNRSILPFSERSLPTLTTNNIPSLSNTKDAVPFTLSPTNYNNKGENNNKQLEKPDKINVIKTGIFYDKEDNGVPVYKTSGKKRGEALIINNIMFENDKMFREGAEYDEKNICELFKQIGFKVNKKRNLKASEMISTVKSFSKSSSLKNVDICIVVVMSHGTNHGILGSYTEVYGVDDKGVNTDVIVNHFTTENCKQLMDKPKIFIFQCCRGNNQEFTRTDATPFKPRTYDDMLIAHSTLPGFVSYRDPKYGTYYIQTICDVFSKLAHKHHVEDLLKIVDNMLSKNQSSISQTSSYESRGFKKLCYLHPV